MNSKKFFVILLTIVALLLAIILIFYFQFLIFSNRPTIYHGKVVDKSLSILESQRGSRFSGRLIIEDNGKKIEVPVGKIDYNRIKVGDEVANDGNGLIILSGK